MLKLLMLRKKLETAQAELDKHLENGVELRNRREAFELRQKEIETSIGELTPESSQEERDTVEQAIAEQENTGNALTTDEETFEETKTTLEGNIADIEGEIEEIEQRTAEAGRSTPETNNQNRGKVDNFMNNRTKFFGMSMEQRSAFVGREEIKKFLDETL